MESTGFEDDWSGTFRGVGSAMATWRRAHPKATLTEIERALDSQLAALRSEMLVDTVMMSEAAHFVGAEAKARPRCPGCMERMVSHGEADRTLTTTGGQLICLRRSYGLCPACGLELFPPR